MSATDEIKARLDIVNYIQQYAPLKKAGRTFKACCPFHNERTPSFSVNPDTQSWRCFGACGEGGDIFSFAMKYHGWAFPEALRELGKLAGVEVEQQTPAQRERAEHLDVLRAVMQAAADFYHEQLQNAPDVLAYAREKRGFNDQTIATYAIGYAPDGWSSTLDHLRQLGYEDDLAVEVGLARRNDDTGRVYDYFRNRLVIPIRDERGRVIGFGARALAADDNPKYLNSPQTPLFDKSRTLYGLDAAKRAIRDSETAIIVEGYMDALQAHQAGFTNVVAQMGTALTEAQLGLLTPRYAHKIILALDSDSAGQNATMRSLEVARQALQADYTGKLAVDIRILQTPGAKDPDDLIRESPELWGKLIAEAVPVADYVINAEAAALPANATVQEREAVARRVLPVLIASENNLYQRDNLQKLALRLRIAERDLLRWADEQVRIERATPPRRPAPSHTSEPPDFPPPDYDEAFMPPDASDEDVLDINPQALAKAVAPLRHRGSTTQCEAQCLSALFQQPDLLYHVNRKFRELAADDEALLQGPLADFCDSDFIQGEYRALMVAYQSALEQDDLEPLAHLRENLDAGLRAVMDAILAGALEVLRPRLRHGLSADLGVVLKNAVSADLKTELTRNALYLRSQRLLREREDLYFLLAEAENDIASDINLQIKLSIRAKRFIDEELQRQAKTLS